MSLPHSVAGVLNQQKCVAKPLCCGPTPPVGFTLWGAGLPTTPLGRPIGISAPNKGYAIRPLPGWDRCVIQAATETGQDTGSISFEEDGNSRIRAFNPPSTVAVA
ncbi:MAG: hypothetical protein WBX00_24325 [Isosphaeraceae bacterium]